MESQSNAFNFLVPAHDPLRIGQLNEGRLPETMQPCIAERQFHLHFSLNFRYLFIDGRPDIRCYNWEVR